MLAPPKRLLGSDQDCLERSLSFKTKPWLAFRHDHLQGIMIRDSVSKCRKVDLGL